VYGVGLDVLGIESTAAAGASSRRRALTSRSEPGEEVSSTVANCPTSAPRSPRCSPHTDIRLTSASTSAGAASRYCPYAEQRPKASIMSAKSLACIRSGFPAPYSSCSIVTSAAFAGPSNRAITRACGSASLRW